jgi:hypothetical protein
MSSLRRATIEQLAEAGLPVKLADTVAEYLTQANEECKKAVLVKRAAFFMALVVDVLLVVRTEITVVPLMVVTLKPLEGLFRLLLECLRNIHLALAKTTENRDRMI